jgi:hypothetical protein
MRLRTALKMNSATACTKLLDIYGKVFGGSQMFETLHDVLKAKGFCVGDHDDYWLWAENKKFYVRALAVSGLIQFGVKSTFDRWANSVDYEATLPWTEDDIEKVLATAESLVKCYRCSTWMLSPHTIANKPHCDKCFAKLHKGKDHFGRFTR